MFQRPRSDSDDSDASDDSGDRRGSVSKATVKRGSANAGFLAALTGQMAKPCSVAGCGEPRVKQAYCAKHYAAQQNQQTTTAAAAKAPAGRWWEKREAVVETVWQQLTTADGLDYYYNTETEVTQWEKPEELMTAKELDSKGSWFWVPDDRDCFVPGVVAEAFDRGSVCGTGTLPALAKKKKKRSGQQRVTAVLDDGEERIVYTSDLMPLKRSSLQRVVADLVLLDEMSPPLILHNLRKRFEGNHIYTNVGTILISINPYQQLPLYTNEVTFKYKNKKLGTDMPPHVFNIAHDAYIGLTEFGHNQSIIISGESGAGKTEATKQCLGYLASLAGSVNGVEKMVLQANPLLEAFGNAKTIRNDNSSRFGKYMEIFFTERGRIFGSATHNYLLEKIRVCSQAPNERNFHIFYQLTEAASDAQRKALHIGRASDYAYTRTCTNVDTIDDAVDFAEVLQAFKDLSVPTTRVNEFLSVVSGVLAIGNVEFSEKNGVSSIDDNKWLKAAASLLGVEVDFLRRVMCVRELKIRGQDTTMVPMNVSDAVDTRNALGKFVYGRLFDFLVVTINKAMGQQDQRATRRIGILDIFGFEIFEHNSFEQLCINFTNEMLQQHFNNQTFKLEEAVYVSEGIQFKHIEFIDNQPMLDLITKRPKGILPLLDEELVMPKGSDKTFVGKLHECHRQNRVYDSVMKLPHAFVVKHYAGDVVYDTTGFLDKNRDRLTDDVVEMLYTSNSPIINILFNRQEEVSAAEQKRSLSKQFQKQLQALMATLNVTEPHYIRCVKPNNDKSPMTFMPRNCMEQLTYSGVFEAVAIRKQGFPFRLSHNEFSERYKCVLPDQGRVDGANKKELISKICSHMKLNPANVQTGRTQMLYRAEEHKSLELTRSIKTKKIVIVEDLNRLVKTDADSMDKDDRERYFADLASAVREADIFKIDVAVATKARAMLEAFVEARMDPQTKRMLVEAERTKKLDLLIAVIQICDENGYQTKLTRRCRDLCEAVTDAEQALAYALQECDETYLEQALSMCDDIGYDSSHTNVAKAEKLLRQLTKAKTMIKSALASLNHVHLRKTVEFCAQFNYMTTAVQECQDKYRDVMNCRRKLTAAKTEASKKEENLSLALKACKTIGYDSDLSRECKRLLKRVKRINEEAHKAKKSLEEDQVRAVVKAASDIDMTSSDIKMMRKLVKGPYVDFVQAQFAAAQKVGDHTRAIRLSVRQKDELVKVNADKLVLGAYPRLKRRDLWAAERWFGNKQEIARNMLRFESGTLHSPLTVQNGSPEAIKALRPKIINCFETVQKFMGQRNTSKMPQRIDELLTDSLMRAETRNEAYLAFFKQMTDNPVPNAYIKAWELLALFVSICPPTPDFEDYCEAWIRQPRHGDWPNKFKIRVLLRKCVYDHANRRATPPPTRAQLAASPALRVLQTRITSLEHQLLDPALTPDDIVRITNEYNTAVAAAAANAPGGSGGKAKVKKMKKAKVSWRDLKKSYKPNGAVGGDDSDSDSDGSGSGDDEDSNDGDESNATPSSGHVPAAAPQVGFGGQTFDDDSDVEDYGGGGGDDNSSTDSDDEESDDESDDSEVQQKKSKKKKKKKKKSKDEKSSSKKKKKKNKKKKKKKAQQ